jgi:hypothetical protein
MAGLQLEVPSPSSGERADFLDTTAGARRDSIDGEELKRTIYADRLIASARPEVNPDPK